MKKIVRRACLYAFPAVLAFFLLSASGTSSFHQPGNQTLVKGVPLHSANGIYFNTQDQLYVASILGDEIVEMDPQTGKIHNRYGPDDGIAHPDDLTFGPDGSLYWTSLLAGNIGRRTPIGMVTTQFVSPGTNAITFSDNGRLFTALDFLGDGLYELDPELETPPRPIITATTATPIPLGFLNAMDFGPDGRLYGPIVTQGRIISLDVDSCNPVPTSDPWNDCDIKTVAGGFHAPVAVKFDSQGRLFAIDHQTGILYQVDVANGSKNEVAKLSPNVDNLAFDSQDHLYVSSQANGSIQEILPSRMPRTVSPGGMIAPGGVAVMPQTGPKDRLFVADAFSLREYDALTGKLEHTEYSSLIFPSIADPDTVSVDGQNLVVTSIRNSKVQVWDPTNHVEVESFFFPAPLNANRFQDDLVVADLGLGGVFWASTYTPLITAPDVYIPVGLAATQDDLYVCDWATGLLWQIYANGFPLTPARIVTYGLSNPEGMAVYIDGSLLVAETGAGRITRVDPTTGEKTLWFEDLHFGMMTTGFPPTYLVSSIAVGTDGAIYVSSDIDNIIYRILP